MGMSRLITDYINGNLSSAKRQAKNYSPVAIRNSLINELGYSFKKATLTAKWLKGVSGATFQEACDAE